MTDPGCICWPGGCAEEGGPDGVCVYCRRLDSEEPCPADIQEGDA